MLPRDFALAVARKAAQSVNCPPADLVRRAKSQAYLFGKLKRAYPGEPEDELRALVQSLRHAPELQGEQPTDAAIASRRPTVGREACADPGWVERARQLAGVVECCTTPELLGLAKLRLGWDRNFTLNVIVAAEDADLLTYEALCWARSDDAMKQKTKTIRIERTLPVPLSPEAARQSSRAATAKLLERERLEAELKNLTREMRARIAEAQKEFYRLVAASASETEERPVPCEQRFDYRLGVVEVKRLDTGELIEARALLPSERQLELGATA